MPLVSEQIDQAGRAISEARLTGRRITLPEQLRPRSSADGYAIQAAVTRNLIAAGRTIRAWKVGAPDAKSEPSAAPILDVQASPARIDPTALTMIGVEAEIAVIFAFALPAREQAYSAAEVTAAVGRIVVAIEVCDSRLEHWKDASDALRLADHQLNHALVTGNGVAGGAPIAWREQPMQMRVDGRVVKECTGCHALDDPLALLPWLANHAARHGGLRQGDAVTTGSWRGMQFVAPGAMVEVEFAGIGTAAVDFAA